MEVILLERVEKLGAIGDVVKVKNGFARNFLLPQHKALLATEANKARFERERASIEARNAKARAEAEAEGKSIDGTTYLLIRQAGETGQLYGSVAARDIAQAASEAGHKVERSARAGAVALGASVEVRSALLALPLRNDPDLIALFRANGETLVGEDGFWQGGHLAGRAGS